MPINYGTLPFKDAIAFFLGKLNLGTEAWTDIWQSEHDLAFVVAGAMKADLVADLRAAVERGIQEGATLRDFRKDFDALVSRHGWAYKGGRNWRTRIILGTNLRQAYNAGREAQMSTPDLRRRRPYGLYKHSQHVTDPRPEHLAWDGLVIPLDDPWWETHTPQNGWGCECKKFALSERDLKRRGKDAPDHAPPIEWEERTVGARGPSPRTVRVPVGIDPGFAYRPGATSRAKQLIEQTRAKAEALPEDIARHLRDLLKEDPPEPPDIPPLPSGEAE